MRVVSTVLGIPLYVCTRKRERGVMKRGEGEEMGRGKGEGGQGGGEGEREREGEGGQ